jgi:hypothetical protein
LQGWFSIDNKITENQWKIAENICNNFNMSIFDLIWTCPATKDIHFNFCEDDDYGH